MVAAKQDDKMVSRYLHIKDWLVVLVVQLCLVRSSADYVWDGSEWKWQVENKDLNKTWSSVSNST